MIEKIIHIFEKGNLNNEHILISKINKNNLPNYEFYIWDEKQLKNKFEIVCKYGGFFVDINYVFLKNIDIFLNYDYLAVFNNNQIKFFGSKKNSEKLNEESFRKMNIKIINPIYLYPELKNNYYTITENNSKYIFGANKIDSPWIFSDNRIININSPFPFNNFNYYLKSNFIAKKDSNKRKYLIVIAHPDDEILFFGEFIINNSNNVKVLCITNSSNEVRRKEFINILQKYNVDYEMWDYSDFKSHQYSDEIKNRLKNYVKNFEKIYTHSLSGETGHPTHILINKYLFDVVEKNLYVSNPYKINGKISNKKMELLKMYNSQKKILNIYKHISEKEDYLQII